MMLPPRRPLTLHIALLAPTWTDRTHSLGVIGMYAQGDTLWTEILPLRVLINTSRFVHEGVMAIRPMRDGEPNPIEHSCPASLVHAAIADMVQRVRHVLRTEQLGYDPEHGCLYRFRYVTDDP